MSEPSDGIPPLFIKDPHPWDVDGLFIDLTRPYTYKLYQHCRVIRVDYVKDITPRSVEHEFTQFTLEYTFTPADPAFHPRQYTAVIEVHRSRSGGQSCHSGSSTPNPILGSAEFRSSNSVPARDQITILGRSAHRTSIEYPNAHSVCHVQFEPSKAPSAVDIVALLSTISNYRPNYSVKGGEEQAHCYWYSGAVWEALRTFYPLGKFSDSGANIKGLGKHSKIGLFPADPKTITEQVKEIREKFEGRKKEMRDMAEKNEKDAQEPEAQELRSRLELSEAERAKAEERASQERLGREQERLERERERLEREALVKENAMLKAKLAAQADSVTRN